MSWLIAPGPASPALAEGLAHLLGSEIIPLECRIFPDGESRVRIGAGVSGKQTIVVQSLYPPVDRHILQMLMICSRLNEEGALVSGVVPYFAYSRQDREFVRGEVVSLKVLARLLGGVGVRRIVTVDIHSAQSLGYFPMPAYSVSAVPLLADYLRQMYKLERPVVISPDLGGSARAEALGAIMGAPNITLKKTRDRTTGDVDIESASLEVDGRDVIIVDDIISTGGTIEKAAKVLTKAGASKIIAACTHPLLVDNAMSRMLEAGVDEVLGTNTVPSQVSKIDVTPVLASHLKSMQG